MPAKMGHPERQLDKMSGFSHVAKQSVRNRMVSRELGGGRKLFPFDEYLLHPCSKPDLEAREKIDLKLKM